MQRKEVMIMLCENCHNNEATFHYTELVDGYAVQHHLCGECAAKMGLTSYVDINGDMPFARLLKGLLASSGLVGEEEDTPTMHIRCPKCNMEYSEFINVGKFGCDECYHVFGPLIENNIKKIHGSDSHCGKIYIKAVEASQKDDDELSREIEEYTDELSKKVREKKNKASEKDGKQAGSKKKLLDSKTSANIKKLEAKLKKAVEAEDYEQAAKLRDSIKALREGENHV